MNPAGIVIAIAGVWVVSQVFAGNMLERLNILKPTSAASGGILPPGVGPGSVAPYVPGGKNNPPAVDFGKFFDSVTSGRYL